MKKSSLLFALVAAATASLAQPKQYYELVKKADSLYEAKDFKNSAFTYSKAFEANDWKGNLDDRYNAACSWALANYPDSAFFNLNRITTLMGYNNYNHITADADLISLHNDNRWKPLLELIKSNKEKAEANLNKSLVQLLDSIYSDDQKYRKQIPEIGKKFGLKSREMVAHWKIIDEKDSINLIKTKSILDKYGWLGADVIGDDGNLTLFIVIQHSDLMTQEKYLPMMREATKNGKLLPANLASLEDRVALGQGKKQIYGSQIRQDTETKLYYIRPLEDPDNVDKRRAEAGLKPLDDYLSQWQIKWDVEQYKKDLAEREAKEKSKQK